MDRRLREVFIIWQTCFWKRAVINRVQHRTSSWRKSSVMQMLSPKAEAERLEKQAAERPKAEAERPEKQAVEKPKAEAERPEKMPVQRHRNQTIQFRMKGKKNVKKENMRYADWHDACDIVGWLR